MNESTLNLTLNLNTKLPEATSVAITDGISKHRLSAIYRSFCLVHRYFNYVCFPFQVEMNMLTKVLLIQKS